MSPSSVTDSERKALVAQLENVFALAQVMTSNAEEAVRLVERTYRLAFSTPAEAEDLDPQVYLTRLLIRARESHGSPSQTSATPPSELSDFRYRLATEFVDQRIPAAFAALPSEQRVLLMMAEVQDLDCPRIGRVLGTGDESACKRLEEARTAIRDAVYASASEAERHLIESGLASDWIKGALQRMADSELVALPPTVLPSILFSIQSGDNKEDTAPKSPDARSSKSRDGTFDLGRLLSRFVAILLLVVVAGMLGYGFTRLMQRESRSNLIALSARQALDVEASFQTTSAEQAERYVYDRLNRRITVPSINEAGFNGVSIRTIAEGAETPVLLYQDSDGTPIVVYVYSYAFLDRFGDRLVLERDVLSQIEEEGHFDLHDLGKEKALVWRRRDDILVAITTGDAEELRQRIVYPA